MKAENILVVGSACSCVLEAGSDRENRSSDVCFVGDTRQSLSAFNMMTALHTHRFRIVSHRDNALTTSRSDFSATMRCTRAKVGDLQRFQKGSPRTFLNKKHTLATSLAAI